MRSLYDFHLDSFVTPKVLRFFYGFFVIVLSIGAAISLLGSLTSGSDAAGVGLIAVPIGYFIGLVFLRMYFELVAAFFRMADDTKAIRRNTGG